MTPQAKTLKIMSLVTMFAGLAIAICGIVLSVIDFDFGDVFVIIGGLLDIVVGATGARKANVPSTAKDITAPSLIVGILCIAAAAALAFLDANIVNIIADAIAGIFSANVTISSKSVTTMLEKI